MSKPGTQDHPLRVAIIGSGPTGFFASDFLLKQSDVAVAVDLYDRLPTPFGLVRGGVAPDHQKIKKVTVGYDKTAAHPRFRFLGNVEVGRHVSVEELRDHYHAILYCTGAQTDRRMGIAGEDLPGSRTATEFVAWYNGHPDFRHLSFDLSCERVAVVGVGNVAVDVARILARTPEELAATDIADYALEALSRSKVKEIVMLGRRGPAQAAFTNPEIKEMGELEGADIVIDPAEAALDPVSAAWLKENPDRGIQKKLDILQEFAAREPSGKPRKVVLRFLVSPVELLAGPDGRVGRMRLVKNELFRDESGGLRPTATDHHEELSVGLVLRSVGYRGVAIPGVPFNDRWGTVPHNCGRIEFEGAPVTGEYVAGWIKRGPSGVIGTNKPCAKETVDSLLEDVARGRLLAPGKGDILELLRQRTEVVTYEDWRKLDELETARGREQGRPRVKFTSVMEMLAALGRESTVGSGGRP